MQHTWIFTYCGLSYVIFPYILYFISFCLSFFSALIYQCFLFRMNLFYTENSYHTKNLIPILQLSFIFFPLIWNSFYIIFLILPLFLPFILRLCTFLLCILFSVSFFYHFMQILDENTKKLCEYLLILYNGTLLHIL